MSNLEKTIFDTVFDLLTSAADAQLKASGFAFLEQRKIKSRVENAAAELAEGLATFFDQEKTSPEQGILMITTCARELKPLAENPSRLAELEDGYAVFDLLYQGKNLPKSIEQADLQNAYADLFPRLGTSLIKISAALAAWDKADWAGSDRQFDQLVAMLKKRLSKSEQSKSAKPESAAVIPAESLSFDVSSFTEESPAPEEVSFTALYPREIGVETWNTLLVYAHLSSAIEGIRKDSERFKDQITALKEVTVAASTPLARGTEITIVPQCEDITFNPQRIKLAWLEDFHRADFRFRADKSLADDAARGRIDIYVGPLVVGTLKLAMLVGESAPQSTEPQEEHGTMYRQDDIFISYSHKDTEVVLAFKKAYEAIGNNILIDIDELRSGQDWNAELLKMIERAEIFQLFWSENSSQSKYCRQEWEYALKLNKGPGFIRPCYWQMPMSNPPAELGHLHFEYVKM